MADGRRRQIVYSSVSDAGKTTLKKGPTGGSFVVGTALWPGGSVTRRYLETARSVNYQSVIAPKTTYLRQHEDPNWT
jgi:hypothetical protein